MADKRAVRAGMAVIAALAVTACSQSSISETDRRRDFVDRCLGKLSTPFECVDAGYELYPDPKHLPLHRVGGGVIEFIPDTSPSGKPMKVDIHD